MFRLLSFCFLLTELPGPFRPHPGGQMPTRPEGCHPFLPDFSQPNYRECVVPEHSSTPTFRPVPVQDGQLGLRPIEWLTKAGK